MSSRVQFFIRIINYSQAGPAKPQPRNVIKNIQKRHNTSLYHVNSEKKTQTFKGVKYSFCFNLLLKTLNLQVSKFPSRHAGLGLDSPGLKLDDGSLAWMVNGCPLITDNDFQNFNHNIFFHLLYSLHSWKKNRIWIIAMMEQSTHEEDGSWDLRRHRERETGEEKPLP